MESQGDCVKREPHRVHDAEFVAKLLRNRDSLSIYESGAYAVRYLFVICGFLVDEPENLKVRFLLGRTPETDHLAPFDKGPKCRAQADQFLVKVGVTTLVWYPFAN